MESSRYEPPVRRSLSDEDLAKRVNEATASHNGMEAVMDLLVAQEALRAQEDAELEAWVEQMEAEGSPEAVAALAKFQGKDFVPQTDQFEPVAQVAAEPEVQLVDEPQVAEPFSWFSKPEEAEEAEEAEAAPVEVQVETVVEILEMVEDAAVVEELAPVGAETITDFERLLNAASAEEEATALEDDNVIEAESSNLVIPSDEHRNRKPVSQLLVWLGASSVLVPLLLSLLLTGFGLTAQSVALDLAIGYLVSGALIATAGLAGKRSGLSSAIISRAVFGVWGNSFPLSLVSISRLILATVILSAALVFIDGLSSQLQPFDAVLTEVAGIKLTFGYLFGLALLLLAFGVSILRGIISRVFLLTLSVLGFAVLLVSLVGISSKPIGLTSPGSIGFVSSQSLAAIAVVIALQLTLWVELAPNISKAIPMKHRGLKVFFAILGSQAFIPLTVSLVALSFISTNISSVYRVDELGPVRGLVSQLPSWSSALLVVAVILSLVYALVLNLKSLSLDLIGLLRVRSRLLASFLAALLVAILLLQFQQQPELRTLEYLTSMLALSALLSAGWIGMFIADVGLRKIAYHELSLNRSYGYYGRFNLLSLGIWFITLALAAVVIPVNLVGLNFTGVLAAAIGLDGSLGSQAIGICLVTVSGMLLTVIARIPQIRKQEKEVLAVESRREQLNDIFIGQE